MKRYLFLFILLFCGFLLYAEIRNRDKPANGEWNLKLEKIWEIERAGEEIFGQPFSMTVSDDGMLYVFDPKNGINYIFDKDGKFINAFAKEVRVPERSSDKSSFILSVTRLSSLG